MGPVLLRRGILLQREAVDALGYTVEAAPNVPAELVELWVLFR